MDHIALEAVCKYDLGTVTSSKEALKEAIGREHSRSSFLLALSPSDLAEPTVPKSRPRIPQDGDDLVLNLKALPLPSYTPSRTAPWARLAAAGASASHTMTPTEGQGLPTMGTFALTASDFDSVALPQ